MVVGGHAVVVGVVCDLAHVPGIIAADVDIEEDHVPVDVLLPHEIVELLARGRDGFRQARLLLPSVQREVDYADARISQTVGNIGAEQTPVGADVNPKPFFRCVIDDLVRKVGPQQRFATHQRQHPASVVVQPVNRPAGDVFAHALDLVVVGPAIPAIEIAFVLDE